MGIFGSSGIRGVVNEDLSPAFVERVAAAAGSEWAADRVAVGRDPRCSGRLFANAATAGFMAVGVDVDRLGVVPTPALQLYLERTDAVGCMITASHNPREYNGMKFFEAGGRELAGEGLDRIEAAVEERRRASAPWDGIGSECRVEGAAADYVSDIVEVADTGDISAAELTVAVDPGHGATCSTSPGLARRLGCGVVTVNARADGRFPGRSPEPVPGVLGDLQRLVEASDAALGVAHDGDGDRAVFVDERGEFVPGDTVLAILAEALVEPDDTVVTAVNASDRIADAVAANGGTLERTPIGSANIVARVTDCRERGERVPLAGESNGGIFLPEERLVRDGGLVLARILELVADRPLGDRADAYDGYTMERRSIRYRSADERAGVLAAIEQVADAWEGAVDRTDGVRLAGEDGWVLARPSGTEPLVRVTAEGPDRERATHYLGVVMEAIENR